MKVVQLPNSPLGWINPPNIPQAQDLEYLSRLGIRYEGMDLKRSHVQAGAASESESRRVEEPNEPLLNIWGECVPR